MFLSKQQSKHKYSSQALSLIPRCTAGYEHSVEGVMEGLLGALDDAELPLLQWSEVFANVGVRSGLDPAPVY